MSPFRPHRDGVTVTVRVNTGAAKTAFGGLMEIQGGRCALRISLNAVPEKGEANAHLVAFLAKNWSLPKTSVSLLSGETHNVKVLLVRGDPAALMTRMSAWLASPPAP